jgi:HD superfamily phosphohydrolase
VHTHLIHDALCEGFTEPVRDALWGHIYLTAELEAICRSAPFARLHRIAQLGPAAFCYPGATHSRAAHSIGVYHLTRRLLLHLSGLGAARWLSPAGVRSMLCAALLHDIGHFPYAHSLKELPLREHESLGAELIVSPLLRGLIGKTGADPELCAAIVDGNREAGADGEIIFYRKLLSGALDPDKLDYLNRDARYCGVPYGAQDVDFIISILHPHPRRGVEIDSRGITGVESVLFSKYLMYRSVYWHRSVRSATSMIKKALFAGLRGGVLCAEDLYGLDDEGLFSLLSSRSHPFFALATAVRQGKFYALAWEAPFDQERHGHIARLEQRLACEEEYAALLSEVSGEKITPLDVIIDVPEATTFETDLFVRDEGCVFGQSSSFFKAAEVASFVKTLRVVRVFVTRPLKTKLTALQTYPPLPSPQAPSSTDTSLCR